ncbi:MAG: hypothetical protein ABIT37_07405 [Luteolibacter sp.]
MGATRRGRESLPELRSKERALLREWAEAGDRIFDQDPTLTLDRRKAHGEHVVAFDGETKIWWKTTHPGKAGIGAEFDYEMLPPFSIIGIFARELLPSEYLARMILQNREFSDDVRLEGYLDATEPSIIVSQPNFKGQPATADQMSDQICDLGYHPLGNLQIGKKNSISFYQPHRRIAMFDAHPGNFFHANEMTIPIDGIIAEITVDAEHEWLLEQVTD